MMIPSDEAVRIVGHTSDDAIWSHHQQELPQSLLVDIAWAFASSGRPSSVVFGALHASVADSPEAFSGTELTTALWACGAAGEVTPQLHRTVIDRVLEDPAAFKAPQLAR